MQNHRLGKTRQRLLDCANVGALGVVEVTNPIFLPDKLKPMLEAWKSIQSLLDDIIADTHRLGRRNCRHHILDVMHAFDFNRGQRKSFFALAVAPNDGIALGKNAIGHLGKADGDNLASAIAAASPKPANRRG